MSDPLAIPPALSALVVDYGGVLTTDLNVAMRAWTEADDIDHADFRALMRRWLTPGAAANPVHALEIGELAPADFEELLADALTTRSGQRLIADGLLQRMFAAFSPVPEMFELLRRARSAGIATALLSNSWGNDYPREQFAELFDVVVISGEVGLRKPAADIYLLCCAQLGLPPSACVFVDDLPPNVAAARGLGMTGVLHADAASTVAAVEALMPALTGRAQPA